MYYLSYIDWTSQAFLDRIPAGARPLLNVKHSTLSTVQPIIKRYMCRLKPPKDNQSVTFVSEPIMASLCIRAMCTFMDGHCTKCHHSFLEMIRSRKGMQWILEWSTFFLETLLDGTTLFIDQKTSHDEVQFLTDAMDAAVTLLCQCTAYSDTTTFISSSHLAKRLVQRIFDVWVTFNCAPLSQRLAISSLVTLDHYIQNPALNAIFTDTVREAPIDTVSRTLPNIVEYVNAYPRGATEPSPPDTYSSNVMLLIKLCRCDDEFREHLLKQNMLVWICRALAVMTSPRTPIPLRTSCVFAELSPFCSSLDLIYTFLLPTETRVELLEVALRHRLLPSVVRVINLADCFGPLMGILQMLTEYGEKKPVLVRRAMNEIVRGRLDVREDLPLDTTLHPSVLDSLAERRDEAWEAWGKVKSAIIGDRDILKKCMNPKCCTKPRKAKLRKCSRCLELVMCSQECQQTMWNAGHKYQCRKVRKGAIL
ncbi:hypothetical protein EDD18DRAFT_511080 [Armillaria luteobubalina]|uniref:MYND-type domain-containing protein n=1 Tax=Armillaria luteobubalina TaxID=153913 RepID=A0AA39PXD3_9AGAR|nr:hypothetical protein EDD18DRAFT_511080 [Armillaria luteobubalina]